MYNFFVSSEHKTDDGFRITGNDYNHIVNVLRMKQGEKFLVSCEGKSSLCELADIDGLSVIARTIEEKYSVNELSTKIYLFQGLPKGDKFELIIQKAVELGVHKIIPVEMSRCVVKLEEKKKAAKLERWQAIAESAAKQSKRNVIPEICRVMNYSDAIKAASKSDLFMLPYENARGMEATRDALSRLKGAASVGILIGPEGGFEAFEVEEAEKNGAVTVSLGTRILRAETAAMTAVAMCMLQIEMNQN